VCGDDYVSNVYDPFLERIVGEECEPNKPGYCDSNVECVHCQCVTGHSPVDTECWTNYDDEVYDMWENFLWGGGIPSCRLITVDSYPSANFLDYIVDDALDCCQERNSVSKYHEKYCNYAWSEVDFIPAGTRDCLTKFIAKGLSDTYRGGSSMGNEVPWIQNYYYPELCCEYDNEQYQELCTRGGGVSGVCSPDMVDDSPPSYNDYVLGLDCGDRDCHMHIQPALKTSAIINSGTCADWSVLTTTLLRKTGYHHANPLQGDYILSVSYSGHAANIVWINRFGKYVVLDYGKFRLDPSNDWMNYCDIEGDSWAPGGFSCGHENDKFDCDDYSNWPRNNIYGCD